MRILELSPHYPPYPGGQEIYVRNLSEHLVSVGHRVTVLTTTLAESSSDQNGKVEVLREPSSITLLNNPLAWSVWRHRGLLEAVDIVHAHNEHSFMALNAAVLKYRVGRPLALTLHGKLAFGNKALNAFERLYARTLGNAILNRADAVFVDSSTRRDEVAALGVPSERLTVVPNAVNVVALDHCLSKEAYGDVRRDLGFQANTKIVLFVGRLIPRKGITTLLLAFTRCVARRDDVFLVIVGDGPLRSVCVRFQQSQRTRGRITLLRWLEEADLYRLYQAADLFVLPSLSEGCPTVLIEAMFFGCRIIASDIAGIRDHFAGSSTLVPPEDISLLTDAILDRLDEDSGGDTAKTKAREAVTLKFDWNKTVRIYDSVFQSVAGRSPRSGK